MTTIVFANDTKTVLYTSFISISFLLFNILSLTIRQFDKFVFFNAVYVILIIIPLLWLVGGGSDNGIHFVIVMTIIALHTFVLNKTKYYLIALLMIIGMMLNFFEEYFSEYIVSYSHYTKEIIFLLYFVTSIVLLLIFVSFYYKRSREINKKLLKNNRQLNFLRRELEKQNEELKEVDKLKDKFYSIVAHDLKSPFSGILGLSEIIVEKAQNDDLVDILEYTGMLHDGSKKTYHLLLDLLEWAKYQSVGIKMEKEFVNFKQLIDEMFGFFEYTASLKDVSLQNKVNNGCEIYADSNMLKTICRNLISNAVKFSENSDVSVSSEVIDGKCRIKISDTGKGMSEDELKNIFDINQTKKGTKGETGMGLGMSLVKEFITKHNSELQIYSKKGRGTDFVFFMQLSYE
jgi:signal transduction histidine kinase